MSPNDTDRLYDLLMEQTGTLAKIEQSQDDLKERLFGADGNPGIIQHFSLQLADHLRLWGIRKVPVRSVTLRGLERLPYAASIKRNHH